MPSPGDSPPPVGAGDPSGVPAGPEGVEVGVETGCGVGVAVASGPELGGAVGLGVGLGVGVGLVAAVILTVPPSIASVNLRVSAASNKILCVPTGSLVDQWRTTPDFQFEPLPVIR
jgi:hypothetical protein